jgi:hypothetical protein
MFMDREKAIVEEIKNKTHELNALFEEAARYYIKFDCHFDDSQSFGEGKLAHLTLKAYREI